MVDVKILLLEDDLALRDTLLDILDTKVHTIKSYENLPSACSADIIIVDMDLVHDDLATTIQKIKQTYGDIQIVLLSSFDSPEFFLEAIKYKIENFVIKPVEKNDLLNTIEAIHKKINYQRELDEQKKLLDQYKYIVDSSTNITITDVNGIITYVNDKFCELCGYSREELIGKSHKIMKDSSNSKEFFQNMWKTLLNKQIWQGTVKNRKKDGTVFYADTTISPILAANGEIKEFISLKMDITDLKLQQYHLERDAITDRLTDLPNRLGLLSTLKQLNQNFQIMLIDLDKFRDINMLFGIQVGDNVLMNFSHTLLICSNKENLKFYRLAADEFLVLSTSQDKNTLKQYHEDLTKYIEQNPYTYRDITFDLEFTSIILTCKHGDYSMIEQLQKLMADAKNKRVGLEIFDSLPNDTTVYKANYEWTQKIKSALLENRMELFFQPIYDIKLQHIVKYESLIRLIDTNGSIVLPVHFLKAAKLSKHYKELTTFVITKACEKALQSDLQFSINLSIEDLTDNETLLFLIDRVQHFKLGNKIIVEILESEGIDNFELVSSVLDRLQAEGIEIAIDDFGSGYSNFSHLTKLPIDILKIDGSLIRNISKEKNARIIVRSIILFAKELGIRCVAEFVSDKETYEIVKSLGVDLVQGYYIAKPSRELVVSEIKGS